MARIAVITHACDHFAKQNYLLRSLAAYWQASGHDVLFTSGVDKLPDADVGFLHVDLSVVPPEYVEASRRYSSVINGAAIDIRKRLVSGHRVRPDDAWNGPVIVKTDLNCGGMPEMRASKLGALSGIAVDLPEPLVATDQPYPVLRSASAVPAAIWNNPGFVVERFLPECDELGYYIRVWIFLGEHERCTRYRSDHPIVKSGNVGTREAVPVPDVLRAERKRLGFDYGKFDFVINDGRVILLDANKTPGAPPLPLTDEVERSNASVALGLQQFLRA